MQTLEQIADVIKKQKEIALVSHIIPDGDAIGSALALGLALQNLGQKVQILNPDGVPKIYTFLPGSDLLSTKFTIIPKTIILLDCSDIDRIGPLKYSLSKEDQIINIDHHISNTFFGSLNFVDTSASATGEVVYKLIKHLDTEITSEIATCLYTAIVTDTGSFQYENTTDETHLIASKLLSLGTDLSVIRRFLWESVPLKSIQLLAETLKTLEIGCQGKIAWISLPFETYHQYGVNAEYIEGLVNYPKSIEGVEIGIFFKEIEPGKIKISLRSKTKIDVNKLAQKFGGGGHKRAAGCILETPLRNAIDTVVIKAKGFFDKEGT
jgi:phosphoesterase RecJ-like protein